MTVDRGQVLQLCGLNGAGKTTVLKSLAGYVISQDLIISHHSTCLIRSDSQLLHGLTVKEQLAYYEQLSGRRSHLASDWLKDIITKDTSALSLGQARRLYLAQLYFSKADVWLLDEPLIGLDALAQERFMHMLDEHIQQGGYVVLASHDSMNMSRAAICLHL